MPLQMLLKRFSQLRLLVFGGLVLDRFIIGAAKGVSSYTPVVVVQEAKVEHCLGGAANVAHGIRALQAEPILVGACGTDDAGNELRHLIRTAGIDTKYLVPTNGHTPTRTRVKATTLADGLYQDILQINGGLAVQGCEDALLDQLRHALEENRVDAVCICHQEISADTAGTAVQIARQQGIPLIVADSKDWSASFRDCTIAIPNKTEFEKIIGHEWEDELADSLAQRILREWRLKAVLVTLGSEGAVLYREDYRSRIPAYQARGFANSPDTLGCGDSLHSALATSLAAGASIETASTIGVIAGGIAAQKSLTASVTLEELKTGIQDAIKRGISITTRWQTNPKDNQCFQKS